MRRISVTKPVPQTRSHMAVISREFILALNGVARVVAKEGNADGLRRNLISLLVGKGTCEGGPNDYTPSVLARLKDAGSSMHGAFSSRSLALMGDLL